MNSGTSLQAAKLLIQAANSNSGVIYVGDSSVAAAQCIELKAGEVLVLNPDTVEGDDVLAYVDVADIWVDASVNAQKVNVTYLKRVSEDYHG